MPRHATQSAAGRAEVVLALLRREEPAGQATRHQREHALSLARCVDRRT